MKVNRPKSPRFWPHFRVRPVSRADALQSGVRRDDVAPVDEALSYERVKDLPADDPLGVIAENVKDVGMLEIKDAWVEAPLGDDWIAAYRILLQQGAPVVVELRVFPAENGRALPGSWSGDYLGIRATAPEGGLTSRTLRSIKIGETLQFGDKALGWLHKASAGADGLRWLGLEDYKPREKKASSGRRGKLYPDLYVAKVAKEYAAAVARGSRRPVAEAAKQRALPLTRARSIVHEARRRGLLSPAAKPGRLGGRLTDQAKKLLRAANRVSKPRKRRQKKGGRQ